ncbi:MAG: type II secretion system protein [Eubacteriales bacterium]|nr:type II secretion system protein [Eubacteriales bacterium]
MKNKIRQDNSGFTLVELIITIAVLAVISVPLLKYFSDSMRHNVRMKEEQNAVVAAQNILEELKVSDINLDDISNLTSPAASGPALSVSWQQLSAPTTNPDGSQTYSVKGNYSLNSSSYTVTAKINPRKSLENDAGGTKTYQKVEVPSMDSSKDSISTETGQYFANAKFHFYGLYSKYCDDHNISRDPTITTSYIGKCLERTITVSVTPNKDSSGNNTGKIDVLTTYTYTWRSGVSTIHGVSGASSYSEDIEKTTIAGTGTHNIYIFYMPVNYKINEADAAEVPTVIPDKVKMQGDITSLGVSPGIETETSKLNLKLYLIADSSVARTNCVTGTYTLTLSAADNINNYVSDVFANLKNTEFTTSAFSINTSTFPVASKYGFHYEALMKESDINRVADIEVSVFKGDSTNEKNRFTTVNGTKVQE